MTNIVNNIAAIDAAELEAAEESSGAISQIVEAFEQQLSNVEVAEGEQLTINEPNVAVQVKFRLGNAFLTALFSRLQSRCDTRTNASLFPAARRRQQPWHVKFF